MRPRVTADFRCENVLAQLVGCRHCSAACCSNTWSFQQSYWTISYEVIKATSINQCKKKPKSCTDLDPSLLYILILKTHTRFLRKKQNLALSVCFPQPCLSDGRRLTVSRSSLNCYRKIGSFEQNPTLPHRNKNSNWLFHVGVVENSSTECVFSVVMVDMYDLSWWWIYLVFRSCLSPIYGVFWTWKITVRAWKPRKIQSQVSRIRACKCKFQESSQVWWVWNSWFWPVKCWCEK